MAPSSLVPAGSDSRSLIIARPDVTHFHGCGKKPWPPGQTFGGVRFERTSVRGVGDRPFFAVGNATNGLDWHVVAVDGTVDVYPAAAGTEACSLSLGPLGKDVKLRAVCHEPP
jgi:hypothetical protein